jgi:hypothetical protein
MEAEVLQKDIIFSRQYWIEHFATWSIGQFDALDHRASEDFFYTMYCIYSLPPSPLQKDCK